MCFFSKYVFETLDLLDEIIGMVVNVHLSESCFLFLNK